jgi:hypothetical protein
MALRRQCRRWPRSQPWRPLSAPPTHDRAVAHRISRRRALVSLGRQAAPQVLRCLLHPVTRAATVTTTSAYRALSPPVTVYDPSSPSSSHLAQARRDHLRVGSLRDGQYRSGPSRRPRRARNPLDLAAPAPLPDSIPQGRLGVGRGAAPSPSRRGRHLPADPDLEDFQRPAL